jgi:hypothetical protein
VPRAAFYIQTPSEFVRHDAVVTCGSTYCRARAEALPYLSLRAARWAWLDEFGEAFRRYGFKIAYYPPGLGLCDI